VRVLPERMMIVAVELLARIRILLWRRLKTLSRTSHVAALMPVRHLRRHYRCRTARAKTMKA